MLGNTLLTPVSDTCDNAHVVCTTPPTPTATRRGPKIMAAVPAGMGARIAQARTSRGLTQAELAKLVETHVRTISRIESDATVPGSVLLFDLADVLYTQAEWLLRGRVRPRPQAVGRSA